MIAGHEFLDDQSDGGRKCANRNYLLLKKCVGEENVYLCMFSPKKANNCRERVKVFPSHENRISQFISAMGGNIVCNSRIQKKVIEYAVGLDADIIFCERSIMGKLVKKIIKGYSARNKSIKVILFQQNIEKNYVWNKVKHENLLYVIPYLAFKKNEKVAVEYADKIVTLTERDSDLSNAIYGRRADYILPMTFDDTLAEVDINDSAKINYLRGEKKLLFVGSLFQPNLEGLKWFITNIMPYLGKDIVLSVIGRNWEFKKEELQRDNVDIIGSVSELLPYYVNADAVVLPIFYGDGMKVKTAEAIMYGKTIFASDEALEGYKVDHVKNIFRCNTREEYLKVMSNYFRHDSCVVKINNEVRNVFLKNYETNSVKEDFECFLNSI